jgi:uncharacterized protein
MSRSPGSHLAFPFRIGEDGRTASVASVDGHVRDEVLQLVLTAIGERLFQPEVGTNVRRLVFENVDETTAGMTKSTISQALARWLGHRVELEELLVETRDATITVDVRYRPAGSADARVLRFQRSGE